MCLCVSVCVPRHPRDHRIHTACVLFFVCWFVAGKSGRVVQRARSRAVWVRRSHRAYVDRPPRPAVRVAVGVRLAVGVAAAPPSRATVVSGIYGRSGVNTATTIVNSQHEPSRSLIIEMHKERPATRARSTQKTEAISI